MASSLNWKAKDGIADGAHPSFWHCDWDTTQTGKHPNMERGIMKGPKKADLNSLCLFISCSVCETDTDLCANADFHNATVSSTFWPFFMHSRCRGGHGNTCRRLVDVNVYVLGFARKTNHPALSGAAI